MSEMVDDHLRVGESAIGLRRGVEIAGSASRVAARVASRDGVFVQRLGCVEDVPGDVRKAAQKLDDRRSSRPGTARLTQGPRRFLRRLLCSEACPFVVTRVAGVPGSGKVEFSLTEPVSRTAHGALSQNGITHDERAVHR